MSVLHRTQKQLKFHITKQKTKKLLFTGVVKTRAGNVLLILRNIHTHSCNYFFCLGIASSIAYSERVFVALPITQCDCAILSSAAGPSVQYFSPLPHKKHDFRKELLNIKCISIFSTMFCNISKNNRASYDKKNVYWSSCNVHVLIVILL